MGVFWWCGKFLFISPSVLVLSPPLWTKFIFEQFLPPQILFSPFFSKLFLSPLFTTTQHYQGRILQNTVVLCSLLCTFCPTTWFYWHEKFLVLAWKQCLLKSPCPCPFIELSSFFSGFPRGGDGGFNYNYFKYTYMNGCGGWVFSFQVCHSFFGLCSASDLHGPKFLRNIFVHHISQG